MKLKVLGMCAIASLLYGENVFANVNVADSIKYFENLGKKDNAIIQGKNNDQLIKSSNSSEANGKEFSIVKSGEQNLVTDDKSIKPTHSFEVIKEFSKRVKNGLSCLARNIEEFKQDIHSYGQEEQRMTLKERINTAKNLSESKKNLISTLDENIANFELLQNILRDLEMDKKIEWLKDSRKEMESLLKDIDITIDDMERQMSENKEERRQRKAEQEKRKQEAAEKRKKKEESRRPSERAGQDINWQAINGYRDDLFKFIEMIGLRKLDFKSLITYGDSCFSYEGGFMFDPEQNGVDPRLKSVLMQIYEVSFPESEKSWSETKKMIEKAGKFVSDFSSERSELNKGISEAKKKIAKSNEALSKKAKLENDISRNKRLPQNQKESKEKEIAKLDKEIISDSEKKMILEDLEKKGSRVKELENMISGAYRDLNLNELESKVKALGKNVSSLIRQKSDIDNKKKKMEESVKREELGEGNGYEE